VILARYLTGQFLPPFFFGLTIFSGVLLLDKLFDLIDLLINKGVSLGVSAQIFFLFFPTILSLSVPMSLLLACLLTFGKLSEDNEILALRASGLSFTQILWPPLAVAALISLALLPFNTRLAPAAMNRFRALYHRIASTDPLIQIEPRRFFNVQNARLYAAEVSDDRRSLTNVWIYRLFADRSERVFARQGTAEVTNQRLSLQLEDGQIERFSGIDRSDFTHINFRHYTVNIPFQGPLNSRDRAWREIGTAELRKEIARRAQQKKPTGDIEAELHLRFSMGFAPLALTLIGIPLGMTLERGGRGVGFGAAMGVLFVYYLLLVMGLNVAERGKWPALPALWIANVVAASIGIVLFKRRLSR